MRRPFSVCANFVLVIAVFAACGREGAIDRPARQAGDAGSTSSSTTTVVSTTTEVPTTTTTTTTAAPVALAATGATAVLSPAGVVVPVLRREGDALIVGTPCEREAPLVAGTPLSDVTVVVDPGHGGDEPGAVGAAGLREKDINLTVARLVVDELAHRGIKAVLTRSADYRMTLEARAKVVRALQPKLFVSVHHNAEPDGPFPKPGSETYYQVASPESKRAAGLLYEELIAAFSKFEAAWMADTDAGAKYRKNDSGDDYYGILRRTQGVPAVLSEALFVSNPDEEALLAREDVVTAQAEAIANAASRFLTTADPGSGFTEPYPRTSPAGSGGGRSPACVDPAL